MVNEKGKSVVLRIPTELQLEPNEASPLSRGRDNNSDAESAGASEQSTKKLLDLEMDQSKRALLRIIFDFLLVCCGESIGVTVICRVWIKASQSGIISSLMDK